MFGFKSKKEKEIEQKLKNFYLSMTEKEETSVSIKFKEKKKSLEYEDFIANENLLLIRLLNEEKGVELLNNSELRELGPTIIRDGIGYIEEEADKITFYTKNLSVFLG